MVLDGGASAMSALGCGGAAGLAAIEEVKALCVQIERSGDNGSIAALGQAVRVVSNLMLVRGIVTPGNAGEMMTTLSTALALMGENVAPPESLAAGIDAIGRLAAMDVIVLPVDDAVEMVMDVLQVRAWRYACPYARSMRVMHIRMHLALLSRS